MHLGHTILCLQNGAPNPRAQPEPGSKAGQGGGKIFHWHGHVIITLTTYDDDSVIKKFHTCKRRAYEQSNVYVAEGGMEISGRG